MKIFEFLIKSNLLLCFVLGLAMQANFIASVVIKYLNVNENLKIVVAIIWLAIIFAVGLKTNVITLTK